MITKLTPRKARAKMREAALLSRACILPRAFDGSYRTYRMQIQDAVGWLETAIFFRQLSQRENR